MIDSGSNFVIFSAVAYTNIRQILLELVVPCDWTMRSYSVSLILDLDLNSIEFILCEFLEFEIKTSGTILLILFSDAFRGMWQSFFILEVIRMIKNLVKDFWYICFEWNN